MEKKAPGILSVYRKVAGYRLILKSIALPHTSNEQLEFENKTQQYHLMLVLKKGKKRNT